MISLAKNASIVVLTGAGISAESGIQTFRGGDGLWCGHRIEDVATPEAFISNPELVHDFYNMRRAQLLSSDIKPNAAHLALAELEAQWQGHVHIVTQNIDDLHSRAGNKNLIHMHGELLRMFCTSCREKDTIDKNLNQNESCRFFDEKDVLRPDIAWFGEIPYDMGRIHELLMECELFLSIGTSGNVYPAAGFVRTARQAGAHTIELNLEETLIANNFHEHIHGPATKTVRDFVSRLLG